MRIRKALYVAATVAVAAGLSFTPLPASAAPASVDALRPGIPPTAMPACQPPAQSGGWDRRDIISNGTPGTNAGIPIRSFILRLGEPCVYGEEGGPYEGEIALSMLDRTPPVPMVDGDGDGEDDPPPTPAGPCNRLWTGGDLTAALVESVTTLCNESVPAYLNNPVLYQAAPGMKPFRALPEMAGTERTDRVEIDWAGNPAAGDLFTDVERAFRVVLFCESAAGVRSTTPDESTPIVWRPTNGNPAHPFDVSCSATNRKPWAVALTTNASGLDGKPSGIGVFYGVVWMHGSDAATPDEFNGGAYWGGTQGAAIAYGNMASVAFPTPSAAYCSNTYDGADEFQRVMVNQSFVYAGTGADDFGKSLSYRTHIDAAECPYLVRFEFVVCTYEGYGSDPDCQVYTWTADRFRASTAYPGGTPEEQLCTANPNLPGCYEVLNPVVRDGTKFDEACPDPPMPEWLSFNWLPDVIGYFAHCLFVPLNGFDRLNWVSSAWDRSPMGDIAGTVSAAANSFAVAETCGVIVNGTGTIVPIVLDTCAWSSWAGPIKPALTAGVFVMFGLFALSFVARTTVGIINRRTPDPLEGH